VGWSVQKCLKRTGVPAATMAVGFSITAIVRDKSPVGEAVESNFLLFAVIWLGAAALFWLVTRCVPRAQ